MMPNPGDHAVNKTELIPMLFEHGVVRINTTDGFLLTGGGRAPVYLDHRRLFGIPKLREAALDLWSNQLRTKIAQYTSTREPLDQVGCVGTATAGIAPAFGLATRLGAPFAYVRSSPKAHGLGQIVEGAPMDGKPAIVVDDMVTTGGSIVQACNILRKAECAVILATSFTSKYKLSSLALDAKNKAEGNHTVVTDFVHVFSLRELLESGSALGCITSDQWQSVAQWSNDSGI
jgi:orotate phosphoribosyltransferase